MKYLVVKLISGEMLVALSGETTLKSLNLVYPFEVFKEKRLNEMGEEYDYTGLRPFCSISAEPVLLLNRAAIAFETPLKEDLIETYCQMVEAYITPEDQGTSEDPLSFQVEGPQTFQ